MPTSKVKTASSLAASLDDLGEILRVDRLAAGVPLARSSRPCARLAVVGERVVEVRAVASWRQLRQQRLDRGADVADEAEIEPGAAAEMLRPDVDLRDLGVVGQELLVGEVRAEHQQHVAGMHGRDSRTRSR